MDEWHDKHRAYWQVHDPYEETKTKKCTHCKKVKPGTDFFKSVTDKTGLQAWCTSCIEQRHEDNPARQMLVNARAHARRLGVEFSIILQDIRIPDVCPVFGVPLVVGHRRKRNWNSPSLDRINSSKGYTPDNIQVISWRANCLKRDATVEELEKLVFYMKGIQHEIATNF